MSRVVIHPDDRAALAERFPQRDVEAIHARFSDWSTSREVFAPLRLFTAWVERAETENTYRLGEPAGEEPQGMFRVDGSWARNGHGDPAMHSFVDMLVTARKRGYELHRIAERIMLEPGWQKAFPNAKTWLGGDSWHTVPASTSAERCVIDKGRVTIEPEGERSDPSYAAFRFGIINRILTVGMTDQEIADTLEANASKFADVPGLTPILEQEIAQRRGVTLQEVW